MYDPMYHYWVQVLLLSCLGLAAQETIFELYMPDAHLGKPDEHMMTTQPLPNDKTYYIVEFLPSATMEIVHHMEVDVCINGISNGTEVICPDRHIIYMWARNASKLALPKGVGFKVGRNTSIHHLRLDIHFASTPKPDVKNLGVRLRLTETRLSKTAGVYLLLTGGLIEPGEREHFDVACEVKDDVKMHMFAFRTHTHALGKVVSGYRVRHKHGDEYWTLIGKKNPQEPQMFYPVKDGNEITVKKGDIMAGRCTMENKQTHTVYIGGTSKDEMCNFYGMYWVKDDHHPSQRNCFGSGPPEYHWEYDRNFTSIPVGSDQIVAGSHIPAHVM